MKNLDAVAHNVQFFAVCANALDAMMQACSKGAAPRSRPFFFPPLFGIRPSGQPLITPRLMAFSSLRIYFTMCAVRSGLGPGVDHHERSKKYSAVVAFVILGTVGCYGDRSHSPSASALIQDANHLDGNAFFVWLPPLLQQQAPAEQVFLRAAPSTVTISNLCSGAVIRALSGADVQIADGAYHANWHTAMTISTPAVRIVSPWRPALGSSVRPTWMSWTMAAS